MINKRVKALLASLCNLALISCMPEVNNATIVVPDGYRGPITIKAVPTAENRFDGRLIVNQEGLVLVSEEGFWNSYRVKAVYESGEGIRVGRLRDKESENAFAVWQLPSGSHVKYYYVGKRAAMEDWYFNNKDDLYKIPEERLKRSHGRVEMIDPNSENEQN